MLAMLVVTAAMAIPVATPSPTLPSGAATRSAGVNVSPVLDLGEVNKWSRVRVCGIFHNLSDRSVNLCLACGPRATAATSMLLPTWSVTLLANEEQLLPITQVDTSALNGPITKLVRLDGSPGAIVDVTMFSCPDDPLWSAGR
jgi:hypothetical protein